MSYGDYRTTVNGYAAIRAPEHPRAVGKGYVYEHILIAEAALGRKVAAYHQACNTRYYRERAQ